MSYINRNRARQTGTNRTTQAEISNFLRLSFPGRVKLATMISLASKTLYKHISKGGA